MSTGARSVNNANYFQAVVPGRSHVIAFTNVSAAIADAMESDTTLVRAFATQDCWVKIGSGSAPTAQAPSSGSPKDDTIFIAGGIFCYFGVEPGAYIAVVRDSANGNLFLTEAK